MIIPTAYPLFASWTDDTEGPSWGRVIGWSTDATSDEYEHTESYPVIHMPGGVLARPHFEIEFHLHDTEEGAKAAAARPRAVAS